MKQEIMELLNEIGVVIAEKEAADAISVLNANGKLILDMVDGFETNASLTGGRLPHVYVDSSGDMRNGCPNCYEKNGHNRILYAGQNFCSICGQKIIYNKALKGDVFL